MGDIIGSTLTAEMVNNRNEQINKQDSTALGNLKHNPQVAQHLGGHLKGLITKNSNGVYIKPTNNVNQLDIDGDGTNNKYDYDIDGDGTNNEHDATPYGTGIYSYKNFN